jgi:SAM-dependent methyltransferase
MQILGWRVHALEPSPQARDQALQVHGLKLEDVNALFDRPAKSADVITMWHVLEHVHTPEKYLLRIHEILDEKGALFLALPNYTSFDARWYRAFWGAWDVPRHLWHFSPVAIKTLLDRTGFELIKEYTLPFDAFYVSLISEKYRGGGLLRMIRAVIIGKWSFLLSLFNKEKASSIVYVCQKSK